jgi:DNA-binding MarR family transcriptional regulator
MTVTNPQTSRPLPRFPEELVASDSFLLKRLGMLAKEQAMDAYEETGLSPYHFAVLIALDESSHKTQGAIADALGYDRGQLVGMLDELEEQGFVERRRDPDDRRRHIVKLTPDGKRALGRLRTLSRRIEDEFFEPLDKQQRKQLHALLLQLAEHHLPHCGGMARSRQP